MSKAHSGLARVISLRRSIFWNLAGFLAPLAVAVCAMPWLIRGLGTDRFGILTLAWVVIGYFGLFDLGIGRALTQIVSARVGKNQELEIPIMVWTALLLMLALGVTGGMVLTLVGPWVVDKILHVPATLHSETLGAVYFVAIGIPVVISTAGLRGVLEGYHRFDLVNVVRILNGTLTFLGPLMALYVTHDLAYLIAVLLLVRVVGWLAYLVFCIRSVPALREPVRIELRYVPILLRFGGWMTVTNVVGPFMDYMDRFMVAAFMTVAAVAYYATPYEIVTKLLFLAGAIVGVLFPAFSASHSADPERFVQLFSKGLKYILIIMFPAVLITVALSRDGLQWWLGEEFAMHSTVVLQWLAIGVLVNSLAQVPFALLQGIGRPDLTARLHLVEFPLYLLFVWWAIRHYGIEGAAVAWTVRVLLDAILLFVLTKRFVHQLTFLSPISIGTMVFIAISLAIALRPFVFETKIIVLVLTLLVFIGLVWRYLFNERERHEFGGYLKAVGFSQ